MDLSKMKALSKPLCDIFHALKIIVIGYEVLLIAGLLPIRYLFHGDLIDCVMDGLQNVTQLRNETYVDFVRNYCGLFAIPPNYVQLNGFEEELFVRIEPRNETFVKSVDYFLAKRREIYSLRAFCVLLCLALVIVVNLVVF